MGPDIVHVSSAMFGSGGIWGGAERYALELARAQSLRHPTRLVVFGAQSRRLRFGKLSIHVLGASQGDGGGLRNPRPELLLAEFAGRRVVHLHQLESRLSELCAILARSVGRRVFVTDHGAASGVLPRRLRNRLIHRHLAVSHYAAVGYPELLDRTTVIYGGVDPGKFTPGNASRERLVVFVGRLLPHKGIDVLIDALPSGVRLEIYGRAYDREYLADLIGLAGKKEVEFYRSASDEQIIDAYRRARVLVLPSVDQTMYGGKASKTELFGLTLVEAMACGTPAICTDAGAMHEVVVEGATGYVVPPGDPATLSSRICALLGDEEAWARMSMAAAAHVRRQFTWQQVAERSLTAYGLGSAASGR